MRSGGEVNGHPARSKPGKYKLLSTPPPMASAGEVQLADAVLDDRIKALSDVRTHRARCSRPLPG